MLIDYKILVAEEEEVYQVAGSFEDWKRGDRRGVTRFYLDVFVGCGFVKVL